MKVMRDSELSTMFRTTKLSYLLMYLRSSSLEWFHCCLFPFRSEQRELKERLRKLEEEEASLERALQSGVQLQQQAEEVERREGGGGGQERSVLCKSSLCLLCLLRRLTPQLKKIFWSGDPKLKT